LRAKKKPSGCCGTGVIVARAALALALLGLPLGNSFALRHG
jgi:hypothetical protein